MLFSLDGCDREVIRFYTASEGIDGSRVRNLMTEILESLFGDVNKVPRRVEWFSDNLPPNSLLMRRLILGGLTPV